MTDTSALSQGQFRWVMAEPRNAPVRWFYEIADDHSRSLPRVRARRGRQHASALLILVLGLKLIVRNEFARAAVSGCVPFKR